MSTVLDSKVLSNAKIKEHLNRNLITWVEKTVAAKDSTEPWKFDFPNFHTAMKWVEKQDTRSSAWIYIDLEPGVHEIGPPDTLDKYWWTYYTFTCGVTIYCTESNNCTITLPAEDDGEQWPTLFTAGYGGHLDIQSITIDPSFGGYPYPRTVLGIYDVGNLSTTKFILKDCDTGVLVDNTGVAYMGSSYTPNTVSVEDCTTGIRTYIGTVNLNYMEISSCDLALDLDDGTIKLDNTNLTNNTSNSNVPIGEIQYNGSFIADTVTPMRLKT